MRLLKKLTIFLGLVVFIFCFNMDVAVAHHPHDIIETIIISPNYAQDSTLLVNYDSKELLKSEDGGSSWTRLGKSFNNKYKLSSLDISSQSPKTLFLSTKGDGIYKSEDGGSSWFKVNQGLENLNLDLVSASPYASEVVLAAGTEKGLYRSENGGESWQKVIDDERKITAIAYFPDRENQILIGDRQGNLYLSEDGGKAWQPLLAIGNSGVIQTIAVSPNFPTDSTLFVGTEKKGIFKSIDGGNSVVQVNEGLADKSIISLAISPNYETDFTLFASTWNQGVFKSKDGGKIWQKFAKGLTKNSQADQYKQPHFTDLKISPKFSEDRVIFVGGFDGLFKSSNEGRSWRNIETANSIAKDIRAIVLSPNYSNDSRVIINTFYQGAYLSSDRGKTWTDINKGLLRDDSHLKYNRIGRVQDVTFSPNYREDKTIFSSLAGKFFKSTNEGKSWQETRFPFSKEGWYNKQKGIRVSDTRIVVSPDFSSDRTIYVRMLKGGCGILRSTDGGKSFSLIDNFASKEYTSSLIISPDFLSDQTLFLGVSDGVYKSIDGGSTREKDYLKLLIREKILPKLATILKI